MFNLNKNSTHTHTNQGTNHEGSELFFTECFKMTLRRSAKHFKRFKRFL